MFEPIISREIRNLFKIIVILDYLTYVGSSAFNIIMKYSGIIKFKIMDSLIELETKWVINLFNHLLNNEVVLFMFIMCDYMIIYGVYYIMWYYLNKRLLKRIGYYDRLKVLINE